MVLVFFQLQAHQNGLDASVYILSFASCGPVYICGKQFIKDLIFNRTKWVKIDCPSI